MLKILSTLSIVILAIGLARISHAGGQLDVGFGAI
jgi:hypothetical protein